MNKEFTYKGKTYEMRPNPEGTPINRVCQKCPLQRSCKNYYEVCILIDLKGGLCSALNAHPVLVENERKVLLQKTGPFRDPSEEQDWNEVLAIAKSWGWIQD